MTYCVKVKTSPILKEDSTIDRIIEFNLYTISSVQFITLFNYVDCCEIVYVVE